jgi:nicotinamidase-related amidase
VLARLAADHVVVCGMQTEFCIDATIREGERRGYRVTLVEDAHATYPVDGATEEQIRAQIHRVARGSVAEIVPAAQLFDPAVR